MRKCVVGIGWQAKDEVDELVVAAIPGIADDAAGQAGEKLRRVKVRNSTGSGVLLNADWRGLLQLSVDGFEALEPEPLAGPAWVTDQGPGLASWSGLASNIGGPNSC